jgi:hypothetical protein
MEGDAPTDTSSAPEAVEAEDPDREDWWARVTPSYRSIEIINNSK